MFSDPNLADAFIDGVLPVAWDFQHDALTRYGFHLMIAEALGRKKQRKFLFLVENSFDMSSLQRPEEALFILDTFVQNPLRHSVGNVQVTDSVCIRDSLQPKQIQRVENMMNQQQLNTNTKQYSLRARRRTLSIRSERI